MFAPGNEHAAIRSLVDTQRIADSSQKEALLRALKSRIEALECRRQVGSLAHLSDEELDKEIRELLQKHGGSK